MLKFEIGDEAVLALWYGLVRELNETTFFRDLPCIVLDMARGFFCSVFFSVSDYVLGAGPGL